MEDVNIEDCYHDDINWESEPDFWGCHDMSMNWFGDCANCGAPVRERFVSQGIEVVN